ncbi:hypothetical protein LUZ61_016760 [Rhynchospora tenuis]|uniref:At4g15545-like C-terminal domain-containing protein n=1 Tax=Rhynchospora tenuis TaxID=198213 RepID=A0AAD5Z663_9POAL|nr:hypothetical protein LUZ61_016760 [Rhynchospora tenuis]
MAEQGEEEEVVVEQPQLDFGLPDEVLSVLPSDPFEQLDVARKITSIALATRVARLESESAQLRATLAEKDDLVAELRAQLETLDASLSDLSSQLARVEEEKENLANENMSLSNTVKKLNRDVSKLEVFKKTLMKSLQDEDETPHVGPPRARVTESLGEDLGLPALKLSSTLSQSSEGAGSVSGGSNYGEAEVPKPIRTLGPLASQGGTPRLTPPDSPTRASASGSPTRSFRASSPRRHSIAITSTRNMYDDRSSLFSSMPSHHSSMTSPFDAANQTGRTRVDGKEFFRQVRSRLSYEQFSAFLANVKELNAHKQTREETLRKADEIFGQENKDLYTIFEGLITRNLH